MYSISIEYQENQNNYIYLHALLYLHADFWLSVRAPPVNKNVRIKLLNNLSPLAMNF